eukprot:gene10145-7102_t
MSVSNADYLALIGRCLSVPERSALQCSIPLLSSRYNAPAEFWGKILGIQNDYLIAQVAPKGFFGPRVSFYSVDGGSTWKMLEELTEDQAEYCDLLRGVYQGDPEYEYKMRKDIPPDPEPVVTLPDADSLLQDAKKVLEQGEGEDGDAEEEEAEEEETEEEEAEEDEEEEQEEVRPKKEKPKFMIISLKEHFRISHFVQHHDAACRLTVRGEYILTGKSTGEKNRAFSGQPINNAIKPSCYLKAAQWGKPERNERLYGPTYNVHTDYLSPITDDMPVGVWTVKYDPTLNVVAVQNTFYDGSLFWYRPGTIQHGQVYYGNGERNFELCFTI